MSKLYTEEQVRKLLYQLSFIPSRIDDTIDSLTPIKLPSNEEIEKEFTTENQIFVDRINGAKWMRDKIKGGNNE
jgi:hypothetical protein